LEQTSCICDRVEKCGIFELPGVQGRGRIGGIMKDRLRQTGMLVILAALFLGVCGAGEPNEPNEAGPRRSKAAVIVCKGDIDDGLYKSIKRRSETALAGGAEYLIFEISTYGGMLKAGDDIAKYLILELGKKAQTVAYVTTEAISAGAMISVSCQDIVMLENTTIGDCAPITIGGKLEGVEREKIESFTRVAFDRAAEANKYPRALLRAMVSMQIEVYKVKNLETDEYEFLEGIRLEEIDPNTYDLENKVLIVEKDKLLTLTASDAVEYGVARAQVKDIGGALDFLGERDGVEFAGEPVVLRTTWSEEMVRWLNSPAVMAVLVMLAMLGVYLELSSPGVGLPGLVALICVVVIVGSKYLVDLANWVEVLILVVGLLLLMVEIFVLPGFGVAGISGILCIFLGIFGMLSDNLPNEVPWPNGDYEWDLFFNGVIGLAAGFLGFLIAARLLSKYLPQTRLMSGLVLLPTAGIRGSGRGVSMTMPPESASAGLNVGDAGEVLSTLRPAGKARFGDAIVDVVAEAEFLEKGTSVEIVEIRGNRVVVRAAKES